MSISTFTHMIVKALLAMILAQLLLSCGNSPVKPGDNTEQASTLSREQLNKMLAEADTAQEPEKSKIKLDVAAVLLKQGEIDWARNIVSEVDELTLSSSTLLINYKLVSAKIAELEGNPFIAKGMLWEPAFKMALLTAPLAKKLEAYEARATLLTNIAEYRNAINERLKIDQNIEDQDEKDLNQDNIWQNLMALSLDDLRLESQMQSDPITKGWYTLATISKDNQTNLQRQLQQVDNWAISWPEHPASLRLPADLQLLKQLVDEQPQQVAVLLPLSGRLEKASKAIRDGIMAAYYVSIDHTLRPDIRFYDTTTDSIDVVYETAVMEGAQLVIGPLNKDNIEILMQQTALPVPTLALNYVESAQGTDNLYQFGLGVEDEAIQVAQRAWQDGMRRAMVIAPKGNWGDRNVTAFTNTWSELGGQIVGDYRFADTKDYSTLIKNAMHLNESAQRRREMQQLLGTQVEFEPRRRQDIDMIFMVAYPAQARQIKPTLAFHYAGRIPVYATSHIFNGKTDSKADRDMNAIRFTSLPWFFNDYLPEKQAIEKYANPNPTYQRLYAMGVDVYYLYPRLKQLEHVKQAHFYGTTGALSLGDNRQVVREQTWAQFVKGRAFAMPTANYQDVPVQDEELP